MAYLQDVRVNIVRGTKPMAQAGFGLPLIIGKTAANAGTYGLYSNIGDVSKAYLETTPEYKMADAMFGQTPSPQMVAIYSRDAGEPESIKEALNYVNENHPGFYAIFIPERTQVEISEAGDWASGAKKFFFGCTSDFDVIGAPVAASHEGNIDLSTGHDWSATNQTFSINVNSKGAQTITLNANCNDQAAVITEINSALGDANVDGVEAYDAGSEYVGIRTKESGADQSIELTAGASADALATLGWTPETYEGSGRNNDREAIVVHTSPNDYPECAWAGQNLPKEPGSITWKWKSLNNQGAANYDTTKLDTIRNGNCQTITEIGGVPIMNEGKTTSGEFIDVIRGQDWVKARLEEGLYGLFMSNDKVAMDNVGIAQVESVLRAVLKRAGNMGIIARATTESELEKSDDMEYMYQVTVPLRDEIPLGSKQNRILPDVKFIYYLAGAVHEAEVHGKIKL